MIACYADLKPRIALQYGASHIIGISTTKVMANTAYFICSNTNPIEWAEQNIPFYKQFVQEMGRSGYYRWLWPGEDLERMIKKVREHIPETEDLAVKKQKVLSQYEKIYFKLTGGRLG